MILITGCTGYIGSRLSRHLLTYGYKVRGLIKPEDEEKASSLIDMGMIPYYGDLTDTLTLQGIEENIDLVYHLSGIHSTYHRTHNLYVQGTKNLLQSFIHNQNAAVVLASNSAVYADADKPHTEGIPLETVNPFGKITIGMEHEVMKSCTKYAILRIGEVYGDDGANPFELCSQGITLIGDGMNYTSRLHIKDLINILCRCIDSFPHGVYNVTDNLPVRQIEFYKYVEALSKTRFISLKIGQNLSERLMLSLHGLRTLDIAMDNHLIKKRLNYKFIYPTYKEGLENLCENHF